MVGFENYAAMFHEPAFLWSLLLTVLFVIVNMLLVNLVAFLLALLCTTKLKGVGFFRAAIFFWAVAGFGVVAYLDSFFFRKAFLKLGPEKEKPKREKAEGALFTDEEHREEDLLVQESRFSDPNWNRRDDILGIEPEKNKNKKHRR